MNQQITRPAIRYHGGKFRLAKWILAHFPEQSTYDCYVEPFCGGASVLLQKPPSPIEVMNDLSSEVVNFWDVLRTRPGELLWQIQTTPYSREVQKRAYEPTDDPLEKALRFVIRTTQSYGASEGGKNSGWRFQRDLRRGMTLAEEWGDFDRLLAVAQRIKGVMLENDDALSIIKRYDGWRALFYVDPPYLPTTRSAKWGKGAYQHEMSEAQHIELATLLNSVEGMVIVSGYPSELYNELYAGWGVVSKSARTNGNFASLECLWLSPRVLSFQQLELFAGGGA